MNPNFKPEMITKKLLKACEEQVQKYFGQREMNQTCEICKAVERVFAPFIMGYIHNCLKCPLGNGVHSAHFPPHSTFFGRPCMKDSTFIRPDARLCATTGQLLARGHRLIEILDQHGIEIYDAEE